MKLEGDVFRGVQARVKDLKANVEAKVDGLVKSPSGIAPDAYSPSRAAANWVRYNSLQRHAAFFDVNADGYVDHGEAVSGFKALGMNDALAEATGTALVGAFGPKTMGRPSFVISLDNLKAGKHPGDAGVLDEDGNFQQAGFDAMWAKHADPKTNTMSMTDAARMAFANKANFISPFQSMAEFELLIPVVADRHVPGPLGTMQPAISKERLQAFYSGKLFFDIAAERGHARPFPGDASAAAASGT